MKIRLPTVYFFDLKPDEEFHLYFYEKIKGKPAIATIFCPICNKQHEGQMIPTGNYQLAQCPVPPHPIPLELEIHRLWHPNDSIIVPQEYWKKEAEYQISSMWKFMIDCESIDSNIFLLKQDLPGETCKMGLISRSGCAEHTTQLFDNGLKRFFTMKAFW